jgi:carbohydrate diacid regulator
MKLSKAIAQKIAKEMMKVIPYNINVMDERGVILGSGDPARIGTLHEGARKAIATGAINEVYNEGDGMRPGVNEPILMNGSIIGVVGITGHPDEVRPFSKLLKVTVVLLIEQESQNERSQAERLRREKFYHELAYRKLPYDHEFLNRAKGYGLDLTKRLRVVLVRGSVNGKAFKSKFQAYPHNWNLEQDKAVFFVTEPAGFLELLASLEESGEAEAIAAGDEEDLAAISLEQASSAMELGTRLSPGRKVNSYSRLRFLLNLANSSGKPLTVLHPLMDQSGERAGLIETLQVYIEEDGDISRTVKRLNIHRNTLNYRLDRIGQLTGKNPRVLLDLFELLCGLMWR